MDSELYKIQREAILEVLDEIESRMNLDFSEGIEDLIHHLAIFSARLFLYFNTEEKIIYPKIKNSEKNRNHSIADDYRQKLLSWRIFFKVYHFRWALPSSILKDHEGFREDTRNLIQKLRQHILKEENEFYILL
ncbi:hemerythrin domain-containing protein [Leptospira sp. WS92.C1]